MLCGKGKVARMPALKKPKQPKIYQLWKPDDF